MAVSKASLRGLRMNDRIKVMREQAPQRVTVKVVCPDETLRKVLKHPRGGGFPTGGGAAEWPDDRFTQRREADGDITVTREDEGDGGSRRQQRRDERRHENSAA
jgi:hypothetical protein